ncbi:MAG: efflux RND transporter permease subunit [Verrucomicrobiales bacterium]|jgi:HAE1 family hydrophobic/amphiphilic exporter-1|nr:efflux RND transporter permease subunit [Verrucomicrobiales bacterium]
MSSLSDPFIRRPVFTMMVTVSVIVFGIICYQRMPVNDLPEIPSPVISVTVAYPGANPVTMANNIATPLEKQFLQIPGIKQITSSSTQGVTTMNLEFQLTKHIDAAATDVQTAITQATGNLPPDLPSPPVFRKTNPNDQPIIYIAISSQTLTTGQLYELATTNIGQRISIVNGVSNVQVYSSAPAVRVKVDPAAVSARGLSMQDVAGAISKATQYQGAGQFDGKHRTYLLTPRGQLVEAEDYAKLIIGYADGHAVYLRDVAEVKSSTNNERILARFYYAGSMPDAETVVMAVSKQTDANAVAVAEQVREILPQMKLLLPGSAQMFVVYDRSQTIIASLNEVMETLFIAFVLVVLVIYVFLGKAADTIVPAVALPISLLMTFIVMNLCGFSIDNLSLLALVLAIGFLVDDAIVFLENTVRRMESGEGVMAATFNSAREISFTILSMTLSLAAVFIPLVFMPGQVGLIFREFGVTIIITVICSGVVSLTLTPLMCSRVLGERAGQRKLTLMQRFMEKWFGGLTRLYGKSLDFFLHHTWISILAWIVCAIGSVWIFLQLPRTFLPAGDSGLVRGAFIASQDASPEKMQGYQRRILEILRKHPDLNVGITITGVTGFLPSNLGGTFLFLKDRDQRKDINSVIGELTAQMMQIPGIMPLLQPEPVLKISAGATANTQGKYAFAMSGLDPDQVYKTADVMIAKMWMIPGMQTVSSDMNQKFPQLQIDILREQAMTYGVSVQDIETALRNAYSQNYLYLIKTERDQYQLIMEVDDRYRANPEDLSLLYVKSVSGNLVPLNAVVKWRQLLGPQQVNHIDQFTSVTVFFNLKPGVAIGTVADEINKLAHDNIPQGILYGLKGDADIFAQLFEVFPYLLIFSVFIMYVILGILYESYLHPLTVLSTLVPATVGGLATLWVFGQDFSLYSMIGIFMLIGIVKKNGILIVDFALQQMDLGKKPREAVEEACVERFRPIIMTTLAAVMGAIPLAVGWGAGGGTRVGLGLAIIGGLLVSQVLTLYVTPVSFLLFEAIQKHVLDKTSFFKSSRIPATLVSIKKSEEPTEAASISGE